MNHLTDTISEYFANFKTGASTALHYALHGTGKALIATGAVLVGTGCVLQNCAEKFKPSPARRSRPAPIRRTRTIPQPAA